MPVSLSRPAERRLLLFAGRSAPALSARIARSLGVEVGAVDVAGLADGSGSCRYLDSVRGADVFIVQTACPPLDDHLVELLIMINAARLASAKRVAAVIPRFFYAGHDRKSRPREAVTARLVAEMLESAGADRVLTMDLHAGQVQGFFSIPVDHMTALPLLAEHFRGRCDVAQTVVVSPDTGRTALAGRFASLLGTPLAFLNRDSRVARDRGLPVVVGAVAGKTAILIDDFVNSGRTLVSGAASLIDAGAGRVLAGATHGVFSGNAVELLTGSAIEAIVITDTVPHVPAPEATKIEVLTISGLLAATIANVFEDSSVSALFAGPNVLF